MDEIITTTDLKKSFRSKRGPVEAVRGVSISVARGEVFGFLGPNGAGKTTTLRMLTTLLPIDSGTTMVAGIDVGRDPKKVRTRIGYVSQLGGADNLATGRENLILQGRLYGHDLATITSRTARLMEILDIAEFADRKVKTYSGGQRRRLDVAMGIIHEPEVLFLDEPSTGLDPQNRANLWEHIAELRERGTTIFLTTHYLEEADALCDRLVIMDHGEIVTEGSPRDLKREVAGDAVVITVRDGSETAARAVPILERESYVREITAEGDVLRLYVEDGGTALPQLLRLLDAAQIALKTMTLSEPTLDDVFMRQTGRSLRDTGGPGGEAAGMKNLTDIGLLYKRYTLQMLRNPVWLVVGFSTPILYLALFTPLLKLATHQATTGLALEQFLPGILSLMAFASGSSAGFGTIFELQLGVIERFRVTPASRFAILFGPILSGLSSMLVFDLVVVVVGLGFGFTAHWGGLFVLAILLCLLAAMFAAFSIATAISTNEISAFAAVINGINLPLLLLAGVLLPIRAQTAPEWMQVLAHFNPLYYLVSASRALATDGFGRPEVWQAFAVLVPLSALQLARATRVFRKAVA